MWEYAGTSIAVIAFVLQLILIAVGGTRALGRMEAAMVAALGKHKQETDDEFSLLRREVGETVSALRQKVYEIELWVRDNCVRREGFYKVKDELTESIKDLGKNIDERLQRMENKIDSKT